MSDVSVITIVRNRPQPLARLAEGLARSSALPRELIIVDMSDVAVDVPTLRCPVHRIAFGDGRLALAAARNAGARAAQGQQLLFLDVDCIPRRDLVAMMSRSLHEHDALICPEVRYLGPDVHDLADDDALLRMSVAHPARRFPASGTRPETNAGLFWSLTFAVRRLSFEALGGFDEGYQGYGAEDTDFGFRARSAKLPLLFLGGTGSFHQYHGVISPPLHHAADIVRNASRFYARWGVWPMDDWLRQFAQMGIVAFTGEHLQQLRQPTADEIAAATQPASVVF